MQSVERKRSQGDLAIHLLTRMPFHLFVLGREFDGKQ
jgi:hypothetical protein